MISHFLFGFAFLVFYLIRFVFRALFKTKRRTELYFTNRMMLESLSAQYGGRVLSSNSSLAVWHDAWGNDISVRAKPRPVFMIQVPISFPGTLTFQRLPRMVFAFLESFLPADQGPYLVTGTSGMLDELKQRPGFQALFQQLGRAGFSLRLDGTGLKAWRRLKGKDTDEIALMAQIRLVREFGKTCAAPLLKMPLHELVSDARCAYCKESISEADEVIHCASCSTPHHRDCFELNGKCSVFGCSSANRLEELELQTEA